MTFLCFIVFEGNSQYTYKTAKSLYQEGQYKRACDAFKAALTPNEKSDKKRLIAGLACYECRDLEASNAFLTPLVSQKKVKDEYLFYLARTRHGLGDYTNALKLYKAFIKKTKDKHELTSTCKTLMTQCWTGSMLLHKEELALVQNAGEDINTEFDEMRPIPSPTVPNRFYFSKANELATGGLRDEKGGIDLREGKYRFDVYTASMIGGIWQDDRPIDPYLNTNYNDVVVDFSEDGQKMFFQQYLNRADQKVIIDTFSLESKPFRDQDILNLPSAYRGGPLDFWQDSFVIFSSEQSGGYGGLDLYISYNQNGKWSKPKNLGSSINTSADEVEPFLTTDGQSLYYASNSEKSIGGYDIFRSDFSRDNFSWSVGTNQGVGINSPFDDRGFRISGDGQLAMMYSDRYGTQGGLDIFLVYFQRFAVSQLKTPQFDMMKTYVLASRSTQKIVEKPTQDPSIQTKIETHQIPAFYNVAKGFLTNSEQKVRANQLAVYLKQNENSKVVLEAFSARGLAQNQGIFFAASHAMELKNHLVESGVSHDRILVKSFGGKYPLVKTQSPQVSPVELKWNNRITVRVITTEENQSIDIDYEQPSLDTALMEEERRSILTGLNYRIVLQSTNQMNMDPDLADQENVIIFQEGRSEFNYELVDYMTYLEAREALNIWLGKGYLKAEIVPYIGEKALKDNELLKMSSIYPDLQNYISEN